MCRECQPEMFPTQEQEDAYAEWFRRYRAYQGRPARKGRPVEHVGCSIEGCHNAHYARGLCVKHYFRDYRSVMKTARIKHINIEGPAQRELPDPVAPASVSR